MNDPMTTSAPVKEIEITPEMIEAGGRAVRAVLLDELDIGHSLSEMVAERVLRAALRGEYNFTTKGEQV
jgi:hypothetical protein